MGGGGGTPPPPTVYGRSNTSLGIPPLRGIPRDGLMCSVFAPVCSWKLAGCLQDATYTTLLSQWLTLTMKSKGWIASVAGELCAQVYISSNVLDSMPVSLQAPT